MFLKNYDVKVIPVRRARRNYKLVEEQKTTRRWKISGRWHSVLRYQCEEYRLELLWYVCCISDFQSLGHAVFAVTASCRDPSAWYKPEYEQCAGRPALTEGLFIHHGAFFLFSEVSVVCSGVMYCLVLSVPSQWNDTVKWGILGFIPDGPPESHQELLCHVCFLGLGFRKGGIIKGPYQALTKCLYIYNLCHFIMWNQFCVSVANQFAICTDVRGLKGSLVLYQECHVYLEHRQKIMIKRTRWKKKKTGSRSGDRQTD